MSEITVEAAAYNLQLEEKTRELVRDAFIKLLDDPIFVENMLNNYNFMSVLANKLQYNYIHQQGLKNFLIGQLNK